MVYFYQNEIDFIISEDLPLFGLASFVLNVKGEAKISFASREDGVLGGVEEVKKIFERFEIKLYQA